MKLTLNHSTTFEFLEQRMLFSYASQIADNVFPIGVYSQPKGSTPVWKSRGVNTMVAYEDLGGTVGISSWAKAVKKSGMYQIRAPISNSPADLAADAADRTLLAWQQPDEPDRRGFSPETLAQNYNTWKSTPNAKPVFMNLTGGLVLGLAGGISSSDYQNNFIPYTDLVSNDWYPVTGWNAPGMINFDAAEAHHTEGSILDRLASIANIKPLWSIIETSDQNLSWTPSETRGVYAQEFRGQFWDSIIHGTSGIVYFPQKFDSFKYDVTPKDVIDEMKREANWINGNNYGTLSKGAIATLLHSTSNPTDPALAMNLSDSHLEGTTRTAGGNQYFFVLNQSWNEQAPNTSNYTPKTFRVDLPNSIAEGTAVIALPDPQISLVKGKNNTKTTAGSYRILTAQKDSDGRVFVMDSFTPFATHIYRVGNTAIPASARDFTTSNSQTTRPRSTAGFSDQLITNKWFVTASKNLY